MKDKDQIQGTERVVMVEDPREFPMDLGESSEERKDY